MRPSIKILFICMLTALCSFGAEASQPDAGTLLRASGGYLDRGDFEHAIETALAADRLLADSGAAKERLGPLRILSAAYLGAGHFQEAGQHLRRALDIALLYGGSGEKAEFAARLGGLYLARGMADEAGGLLSQALEAANAGAQTFEPYILNKLGTLQALGKNDELAAVSYNRGISLARQYHDSETLADILLNLARLRLTGKEPEAAGRLLHESHAAAVDLREDHAKALLLLGIGRAASQASAGAPADSSDMMTLSQKALTEAAALAERLSDHRALSFAYGYLGGWYEDNGQPGKALETTRRAILEAEQVRQGEGLYLWQWQTGRILKKEGRPREAADAYRLAIRTLATIRDEVSSGCFTCGPDFFREKVEPVYFGLAELLFDLSEQSGDHAEEAAILLEARRTIEAMKGAELHDYFRDPCVDAYMASARSLEKVEGTAAVLYVIPLATRLELLLSMPAGMKRFTVNVLKDDYVQEVRAFRKTLEKRTTREYMVHSRKLYSWLIAPLDETLVSGNIETLVFVPDQWLRTVPLAALHNGSDFLVSRFSVATTQGLTLTDPKPMKQQEIDVLIAGITEPVQGYPALRNVSDELDDIGRLYPGRLLKDRSFVTSELKKELSGLPFSIVHIASHGEFSGDVQKSFLLAWDERLSMDQLEGFIKSGRFRKVPVELLTLSACQTAAGDDKAALGLAGVAVKAGARSAIATLWSVSDEASYRLIVEFYRQFRGTASLTKAKALRQAQLSLLTTAAYRHPYYWAPFILIGNWL